MKIRFSCFLYLILCSELLLQKKLIVALYVKTGNIKIAKKGRPLKCKNSFWNLLMIKFDMVLSKLIETVLVQKGGKYVQVVFSVV